MAFRLRGGPAGGERGLARRTLALLGEAVLDRRREISVEGHSLWLISPEDRVVLRAFSDRDRVREDLVQLVRLRRDSLDLAYVRDWARRLDESIGTDEAGRRVGAAIRQAQPSRPEE